MTNESDIDLSRRKVLGGLGAIGVASAGAGLGTSAYFSDEESFTDNSLSAGELDLYVHYEFTADQGGVEGGNLDQSTSGKLQGGTDGQEGEEVSVEYDLADVKPGDSGCLEFCFSLVDNPAYLWMGGELTANDENTVTEPEAAADSENNDYSTSDIDGNGELAGAVDAALYYEANKKGNKKANEKGDKITEGSLKDVLEKLENGIELDGKGDADAGPGNQKPFDGGEDSEDPTDDTCVYLEWKVPTDVENEIQTDSVEFDLTFYAEQSRHNDGENNPYDDGDE